MTGPMPAFFGKVEACVLLGIAVPPPGLVAGVPKLPPAPLLEAATESSPVGGGADMVVGMLLKERFERPCSICKKVDRDL